MLTRHAQRSVVRWLTCSTQTTRNIKGVNVSDDTNSKIGVTLKAGPGYDAPWVVIRGDSAEDVLTTIKDVNDAGLLLAVRIASQAFQAQVSGSPEQAAAAVLGATPVPDTASPAGTGQPVSPAPGAPAGTGVGNYPAPAPPSNQFQNQQLPAALAPACPTCGGPTKMLTDGKNNPPQWKGWFCQNAPRGGPKHQVTWIK